ncbi:MAG TPA: ABC transporter substrate-binding protein [Noviherbaspirillum sp.]|uniref:MlaC/ttg2D family ABC transporter substrate-binding protein n=1 Tax=Noviherbaspirillum sp. TaxID=1926288 RepID=UPI002F9424B7
MFTLSNAIACCVVAASLLPGPLQAQQEPQDLVRQMSQDVIRAAKEDPAIQRGDRARIRQLVERVILPHVDTARMTALAAGRHWQRATPGQQDKLAEEFRELLMHVYSGAIAQVRDKELVFAPMRGDPASGEVEVRSQVVQKGGVDPIELNYRLARAKGEWKVYDVSVHGVWLVQSYRDSFSYEIGRNGIDGLISALSAKNDRLAGNAAGTTASGN